MRHPLNILVALLCLGSSAVFAGADSAESAPVEAEATTAASYCIDNPQACMNKSGSYAEFIAAVASVAEAASDCIANPAACLDKAGN